MKKLFVIIILFNSTLLFGQSELLNPSFNDFICPVKKASVVTYYSNHYRKGKHLSDSSSYVFNKYGKLLEYRLYNLGDSINTIETYNYDSSNLLIEKIFIQTSYSNSYRFPISTISYLYFYDSLNRVTQIKSSIDSITRNMENYYYDLPSYYNWEQGNIPFYRYDDSYTYSHNILDSKGVLLGKFHITPPSPISYPPICLKYNYNAKGKVESYTWTVVIDSNRYGNLTNKQILYKKEEQKKYSNMINYTVKFNYDKNGNLILMETHRPNKSFIDIVSYNYKFDNKNNWTFKKETAIRKNKKNLIPRKYQHYKTFSERKLEYFDR